MVMRKFRFHWLGGNPKTEEGEGHDVSHAFAMLGYGSGAIRALDYYEEITDATWTTTERQADNRFSFWLGKDSNS